MLPEPLLSQWGSGSSFKVPPAGPSESSTCRSSAVAQVQSGKKSSKSHQAQQPPPTCPQQPGYSRQLGFPQLPRPSLWQLRPRKADESAGGRSPDLSRRPSCGTSLAPSRLLHRRRGKPPGRSLNCALQHCPWGQTGVME